jgi:hypothetical protein
MTMPNFLIIGAAKSGTTSLYTWLNQHPQVYMTPTKETNFFAFEGEKLQYPKGTICEIYLSSCRTNLESYQEQFQGVSTEIAIGESSPSYLYYPKAAERIKYYIPDIKLIAILRNPVERAYSQFLHHARENFESCLDFNEALQHEQDRIRDQWWWGYFYLDSGFYYPQLRRYMDLFKKEQIRVYLYEDLRDKGDDLLRDIFNFIGVNDNFSPDTSAKYNVTGIPKNRLLHHFLSKPNFLKSAVKGIIPQEVGSRITTKLRNSNLVKPQFPEDVRAKLIKSYEQDILALQDLIERDLAAWLK